MFRLHEDPPVIGDWCRENRLGSGGFGVVTLWRNKQTQQMVAIKKFHILLDKSEITDKHCERWRNEVALMTDTVRNENIVKTVTVQPESFLRELLRTSANGLPVLCMEYCEGGDLRRVMNQVENCAGLREQEVRNILKSLRNAIAYLHSLKITHRDIKPENLVLKSHGERVLYKLTDLGYAKALDKQSLNASLVGTVEYIAPDLIYCDRYNCSVDYWSMGVIGFEIVTGVRPFIPHAAVAKWMLYVQQKKSAHIAITEDNRENYTYHNDLFPEHHISRGLQHHLERWLTLALEWNPKQRGYVGYASKQQVEADEVQSKSVKFAEDKQQPVQVLKIFTLLDQIFEKKFLTLFSLYDCRWVCVEIDETTDMALVRDEVRRQTGIPCDQFELVPPLEQQLSRIEPTTRPIDLYLPEFYDKPMVFIVKHGAIVQRDLKPEIPKCISEVFQNIKVKLKPHMLRQFIANAHYFVSNEQRLYVLVLDGIKNYGLILNETIVQKKEEMARMNKIVYSISGGLEYHTMALLHTVEKMKTCKHITPSTVDSASLQWQEQRNRTDKNVQKLVEMADKITKRYESVVKRSRETVRHQLLQDYEQQDYFGLKNLEGRYEQSRARILEKITNERSHIDLLQSVYECLKKRDVLLRDPAFLELQQQLLDVRREMDEISKILEKALQLAEKYKKELAKLTLEHNDSIWQLIEQLAPVAKDNKREPPPPPITSAMCNGGPVLPDIDRMMRSISVDEKSLTSVNTEFILGGPVTTLQNKLGTESVSKSMLCFGEGPDVTSLIAASESLILTTEDLINDGFALFT